MAANISYHSNLSKRSFKILISGHLFQFLLILCLIGVPLNGKSTLDIISNPLFVSKVTSVLLTAVHLIFQIYLWSKGTTWRQRSGHNAKVLQEFGRCVLLFCLSVIFFYCIAVLFGAAFSEKTAETFHFAILLSASTCAPALIHLGLNSEAWFRVFIHNSPELGTETAVFYTTICSIAGAWLGAFPIPLDWDRPWQVWPISCVIGTIGGHAVGLLITAVQLCRQFYRVHKSKVN